nr:unnamed protein product [Digitaria exilis]
MLARAFGLVGEAWQRTTMSAQALSAPLRRSNMPRQVCHLHSKPAQPEKSPEELHHLLNNTGEAPPMLSYISEQNRSNQRNDVSMENSADAAVGSIG